MKIPSKGTIFWTIALSAVTTIVVVPMVNKFLAKKNGSTAAA